MKTYMVVILSVLLLAGSTVPCVQADQVTGADPVGARTFSGTIEGIDPMQQIVSVQSEGSGGKRTGEVRLLAFTDAEMVKGLSKGDRVVIELDERGMAKKITKADPAAQGAPDSTKR